MHMNKEKQKIVPALRFPEYQNSEDWTIDKFSSFIKLYRGSSPRPISKYLTTDDDGVNWIKIGDTKNAINFKISEVSEKITIEGSKKSRNVVKGELILANSMSYGATYELDIDGCIYDGWFVLREYENAFDKHFLIQLLNSSFLQTQYKRLAAGGIVQNISSEIVYNTLLPKLSKQEQQKIANCLSSLDTLITAETEKLDHLKDHKKGLLQQLFPAKGETKPQFRFPEFENDSVWEITTLGEIAKFRRGSFPQPYGRPEWYDDENGMPFIQVYDVDTNLKIKPKTKRRISALAAEKSVFIAKGTVIITIQGSIGRVAITQYDAYIDRTLLLFEEFYKPIDKLFFAYVIQLLFEIEKEKAPGGIIKTITKEVLTSFNIYVPDVLEQQKIAKCLSSLDDLITAQTQKTKALKKHKKGLMQKLFPNINDLT